LAKDAIRSVETGLKTLKLKVGRDPELDVAQVKAVRDAIGYELEIRVDPNQAWSVGRAVRQIKKMARYDPQYIEQPIPRFDLDGLAFLRKKVEVPIAICEGLDTIYDAVKVIKKEAADVISSDPIRMGGLLGFKKLCGIAEAAGIPIVTHRTQAGISISAWLQLSTCMPNMIYANDIIPNNCIGMEYADEDVITKPFKHKEGYLKVPEGPGLGVELDKTKLDKLAQVYKERKMGKPDFFWYPPSY